MNNKIKNAKDKAHLEYRQKLFTLYLDTAKELQEEMAPLFNTGIDTKRSICTLPIGDNKNYSYCFSQQMVDDFKKFLDKILLFKSFPDNCKPFEDGARYSLCACYKQFTDLNELEISYAEDVAQYDM